MAADVFVTYLVLSMVLFTVASLIIGYFLLNTAIISSSQGSAYYTFSRITESLSDSIRSKTSTATNINLYPRYVIFSAYFGSKDEIYYDIINGFRIFNFGITTDNNRFLTDEIIPSVSSSYSNQNMPSRKELEKCVEDTCICFAELDSNLKLSPEYLIPLSCVDICWGEDVSEYINYLRIEARGEVNNKIKSSNQRIASLYPNGKCADCVNYIQEMSNYDVLTQNKYSVLTTTFNEKSMNSININNLKDFSEKTKFSFLTNIIECKSMKSIIRGSGINLMMTAPTIFVFNNNSDQGIFTLMTTENNIIFKILSFEYFKDEGLSPTKSYIKTTFIRVDDLKSDSIFGG